MRKTILVLLALFVVSLSVISIPQSGFAWDTTAAKYYPLKVGNTYVYRNFTIGPECYPYNPGKSRVTIIAEAVMPNGKKYFQFNIYSPSGPPVYSIWKYQRIDSATMNIYGYNTSDSHEYLLDSLLANPNNSTQSSRFHFPPWQSTYHMGTTTVFGGTRNERIYFTGQSPNPFVYYFIEGIGYAGYYYCLDDGSSSELSGCVISGIVYGDTIMTAVSQISSEVPDNFLLKQNYPNPFNPTTKINYELKTAGFVSMKVYNVMGKEVSVLVNHNQKAGSYEVTFDGINLPSGVYYYKIETDGFTDVKKMSLVK